MACHGQLTTDDIEQHDMLGINIWSLVGFPTENVQRGLIDRVFLQKGLPRDDHLYLVTGGHVEEEDM